MPQALLRMRGEISEQHLHALHVHGIMRRNGNDSHFERRGQVGYQTQHRKALVNLLKEAGRALTAREIALILGKSQVFPAPGISTVYRLLGKLTSEGVIKAFLNDAKPRSMVYQMDGQRACPAHLHLKCLDCGKLYHLSEKDTSVVLSAVRDGCSFLLDAAHTTLFGCCAACEPAARQS